MELRGGPRDNQDDHLTRLAKEVVALYEEHKKVNQERERIYHYRDSYLKKRPKKLINFNAEDYYETPREALGFLERFRTHGPAVKAEVEEILADPEWMYLNEADEKLLNELKRIYDAIGEKRSILGHGRPHAQGNMHGEGQHGLHPNAPAPAHLHRPGRYVIPFPLLQNQLMPADNALTPFQQRIRDLIAEFDPLINPLYQQIQALPAVGPGVADTNENRELISEYLALVRARHVRAQALQALAAQQGHDLGGMGKPHHMLRGSYWHGMQNRR
jgi:hypothetical protein